MNHANNEGLKMENYCGPSRFYKLENIPNSEGFKFKGIDKSGSIHDFEVKKSDDQMHFAKSETCQYSDLIGWLP